MRGSVEVIVESAFSGRVRAAYPTVTYAPVTSRQTDAVTPRPGLCPGYLAGDGDMARRHPTPRRGWRHDDFRARPGRAGRPRIAAELGSRPARSRPGRQTLAASSARRAWGGEVRLADRLDLRDRAIELPAVRAEHDRDRPGARHPAQQHAELARPARRRLPGPLVRGPRTTSATMARRAAAEPASPSRRSRRSWACRRSVSLWVRDLPAPDRVRRASDHARRMGRAYWDAENARRDAAARTDEVPRQPSRWER